MELFVIVAKSMVSLGICMAIGFILSKKGIIDEKAGKGLTDVMINAVLPCMIIYSMQRPFSAELLAESAVVLGLSVLFHFLGMAAALIYCRAAKIDARDKGVTVFACMFPNLIYMGLPVITTIFGQGSVFYLAVASIVFNALTFTVGVSFITGGKDGMARNENAGVSNPDISKTITPKPKLQKFKEIFLSVPILSVITGMLLFVLQIRLPEPVFNALSMTGDMSVPLAMIVTGSILARSDPSTLFTDKKIYAVCLIRLVVMPLAIFALLSPFIENIVMLGSVVLMSGMPTAAFTVILANAYKGNSILATKYVCVTTLMSMLTIPVISLIFTV